MRKNYINVRIFVPVYEYRDAKSKEQYTIFS